MTLVLVSLGAVALVSHRRIAPIVTAGLIITAIAGVVGAGAVAACSGVVVLWNRARHADRARRAATDADMMCVEVTSLGVAAGLTFREAAAGAASVVGGAVGSDLLGVLRRTSVDSGARSGVPGIDEMLAEAERSASTGAPLVRSLDALVSTLRRERATRARERLARLPVKLLFPLALLILPGFVIMTVGPAVLGGLSRIGI